MLHFFQPKPILKDLLLDNYVDIHSHLLPGIDDGARNLDDTLLLTKNLMGLGFSEFITTPHKIENVWDNTTDQIKANESSTVTALRDNNISAPFKAAAEYMLDFNFNTLVETGDLLTLKDNYVLVEMSYSNPPIRLYNILFDLQVAGYIPVLAHPERYVFYHQNFDEFHKLKNAGCLFQLNLLATVGYYGEGIMKVSKKLIKTGMYDFVGSDVHHSKHIAAFDEKVRLKDVLPLQEIIANNQFFRSV